MRGRVCLLLVGWCSVVVVRYCQIKMVGLLVWDHVGCLGSCWWFGDGFNGGGIA